MELRRSYDRFISTINEISYTGKTTYVYWIIAQVFYLLGLPDRCNGFCKLYIDIIWPNRMIGCENQSSYQSVLISRKLCSCAVQ